VPEEVWRLFNLIGVANTLINNNTLAYNNIKDTDKLSLFINLLNKLSVHKFLEA
jgi:hypothetical protein